MNLENLNNVTRGLNPKVKQKVGSSIFLESEKMLRNSYLFLFPVGVDKINIELVVNLNSVNRQMAIHKGKWKRGKGKRLGETSFNLKVRTGLNDRTFHFKIYQGSRLNKLTEKVRTEWILSIQFNPSRWMNIIGKKVGENYLVGNAEALKLAMDDL